MPEINHQLLSKYLKDLTADPEKQFAPVYLFFGEEMLVKEAYGELLNALLPGENRLANYDPMEGVSENVYDAIERVNTFSLLPGTKVVALLESRIFHATQDKMRLIENSKNAYDDDNKSKAAKYLLSLMGNLNLSFEDVDPANRYKTLAFATDVIKSEAWFDDLVEYCRQNQLEIPAASDHAGALQKAIKKGFPSNNHLVITTEMVDRRLGLYEVLKELGVVIDCRVPRGDRRTDRMAQEDVLRKKMTEILAPVKKKMDNSAYAALLDMTGFDLRTFCSNLEQLVDYVGQRDAITAKDVTSVLKRTKQDPIYDLTNAIADRQVSKALFYLNSLLTAGFHPLQILAAIVNQIRRLILAKDYTGSPQAKGWQAGVSYTVFQQNILPSVVDYDQSLRQTIEKWERAALGPEDAATDVTRGNGKKIKKIQTDLVLARNPKSGYPVYQLLKKSAHFTKNELLAAVDLLNETDVQLKTSSQDPKLILDRLVLKICNRQAASS
jgi:DNA polymerase-3 subunit delta